MRCTCIASHSLPLAIVRPRRFGSLAAECVERCTVSVIMDRTASARAAVAASFAYTPGTEIFTPKRLPPGDDHPRPLSASAAPDHRTLRSILRRDDRGPDQPASETIGRHSASRVEIRRDGTDMPRLGTCRANRRPAPTRSRFGSLQRPAPDLTKQLWVCPGDAANMRQGGAWPRVIATAARWYGAPDHLLPRHHAGAAAVAGL
jgi:hypothetical protein